MSPRKLRNLADTPFSESRLFIWALGIYMILGILGMIFGMIFNKNIPPQLMTTTAVVVGIFGGRVERNKKEK